MAETPDLVDVYVGNSIRALRLRSGISQSDLAFKIGVSFQQVQKYERASNRVSCSMLSRIASYLNAPVETFFPRVDEEGRVSPLGPIELMSSAAGGLDLADAFMGLPPHARSGLIKVAESMAEAFAEEPGPDYVTGGDGEARRHVA